MRDEDAEGAALIASLMETITLRIVSRNWLFRSASWQVQLLCVEKPEVRNHQRHGGGLLTSQPLEFG